MPPVPWISISEIDFPDDPEALEVVTAASNVLYALSGRKYAGVRTVTDVYDVPLDPPLHRRPYAGMSSVVTAPGRPYLANRREIRLKERPVVSVNLIRVGPDRRSIGLSEYEFFNGCCIRPTRDATWRATGEVEVTYTAGAYPPELGKRACRVLANEMMKARRDPNSCALPERVTSVAREGISMQITDPQEFLDHGRTGLYEVDLFLKVVNPSGALVKPRVASPDLPRVRRTSIPPQSPQSGRYTLEITRGVTYTRTFSWISSGSPVALGNDWMVDARIKVSESGATTLDLAPFTSIEPGGSPGRISLTIPADVTAALGSGGVWYLDLVRVADPGTVVRLVAGDVVLDLL